MMTPSEILKQEVDALESKVRHVIYPDHSIASSGLGLMPEMPAKHIFDHILIRTREYRDEGCATYKLIVYMKDELNGASRIYWRRKPKVVTCLDFETNYARHSGVCRFSTQRD